MKVHNFVLSLLGANAVCTPLFIANASQVKGSIVVTYNELLPAYKAGALCADDDTDCKNFAATCNTKYGHMLNSQATVDYDINPDTAIHQASYSYDNTPVKLSAMGIQNKFAFISSSIPDVLQNKYAIKYVVFNLNKDFKAYTSNIVFHPLPYTEFQCVLFGNSN